MMKALGWLRAEIDACNQYCAWHNTELICTDCMTTAAHTRVTFCSAGGCSV